MKLIPASEVLVFFNLRPEDRYGSPQNELINTYYKNSLPFPIHLCGMSETFVRNIGRNLPIEEQERIEEFILAMRKKKN